MDVAKHISLFLLKNRYCQLQGLGNLEIRRTTAVNSGANLNGGAYSVNWNASGGIDDQLPLFIAMRENISGTQAATALGEFVTASKLRLQAGEQVALPGIGTFRMHQGQLSFHTDEQFSLPEGNIPLSYFGRNASIAEPVAERTEPAPAEAATDTYAAYNNFNAPTPTNWGRIGFWILGILVILSAVAGILRYTVWDNSPTPAKPTNMSSTDIQIDSAHIPTVAVTDSVDTTGSADTGSRMDSVQSPSAVPAAPAGSFRFILKKYKHLEAAEKRVKKLASYGHPVKVISVNDSLHYVVEELQIAASDTTRVKDSLTRWLSPEGVEIMK